MSGGGVEGVRSPVHYDFKRDRHTPRQLREDFSRLGWRKVVGFHTRNPMHRAQVELTLRAARKAQANLLIHPVVRMTQSGDLDHYTRVRCYEAVLSQYPQFTAKLSLLDMASRLAGPREALWHAIIRKNHGCTHFIVGQDHASPAAGPRGESFYGLYEAQELFAEHEEELGRHHASLPDAGLREGEGPVSSRGRDSRGSHDLVHVGCRPEVPAGRRPGDPGLVHLSRCGQGAPPPASAPIQEGIHGVLHGPFRIWEVHHCQCAPDKASGGGGRSVTLLDGDIVRRNLSSELGLQQRTPGPEYPANRVRGLGDHQGGGIALCAPIAPYAHVRKQNRELVSQYGGYVLVHVSTPLEVCESRDRKGLYAKAKAGIIKEFTGVSDPYEVPEDADVVIDTSDITPEEAAQQVYLFLEKEGYIGPAAD